MIFNVSEISIFLKYNYGFEWFTDNKIFVKGYLFDSAGKYFFGNELISFFSTVKNFVQFEKIMNDANGNFSVIILFENFVWLGVDKIRNFPLFYSTENGKIFISDSVEELSTKLNNKLINKSLLQTFLSTGYVTENKTLINNIFQLQASEIAELSTEKISTKFYFEYATQYVESKPYETCKTELLQLIDNIFIRYKATIGNRNIAVTLSGGYDSRLIAVMLKKHGFENVVCFSYGREANSERSISEKVAQKLGYKWFFVPYNEQVIKDFTSQDCFQNYFRYSANLTSMFFMQDYFAAKYLHHNLPSNTIILTGHSADVIAGSHLNEQINSNSSIKNIAEQLFNDNFILLKANKRLKKNFVQNFVKSNSTKYLPHSIYENWDLKERQAKFINNCVGVYNFFGFENRLPFWDSQLLHFFKMLPFQNKLHKKLYDDLLVNTIFAEFDVNFKKELQASNFDLRKQRIKKMLKPFFPAFMKRLYVNRNAWNFYPEITAVFIAEMKKANFHFKLSGNSFNEIIVQWYLFKMKDLGFKVSS